MAERIKLRGGPSGTASWVYAGEDGGLVVECYDHGDEARRYAGRDVALLARVAASALPSLGEALRRENDDGRARTADDLAALLAERFASYFEIAEWLAASGIPFTKEVDPWA
jgi:hypothetical protein